MHKPDIMRHADSERERKKGRNIAKKKEKKEGSERGIETGLGSGFVCVSK
jgi:hypothetical protein